MWVRNKLVLIHLRFDVVWSKFVARQESGHETEFALLNWNRASTTLTPTLNRRHLLAGAVALALMPGMTHALSADDARDLAAISEYLNSITTLSGEFVQIGGDGVISEGKFFMRRPGRLRFEYARPNPTLVIADGFWVGVADTNLKTLDRFPLSQTPLYLLLKENVNLQSEGAIRKIERAQGQLRVSAADPSGNQQGEVVMVFDANPLALRQWIVTDPQGMTTTIALKNTRANAKLNAALFVIEEPTRPGSSDQ